MTCARARRRRPLAALAAVAAALPGLAAAQAWTTQAGGQLRWQHDSNPSLVTAAVRGLNTTTLSASQKLTRRSELAESGAEAEVVLDRGDAPGNDGTRALGRLALHHRLSGERDSLRAGLSYRRDRPLDVAATAGDVALGRNEQSVAQASLGWSYALSERLTVDLEARREETRPGARAAAARYSVAAGTAALQYAWHEMATVSLSLGQTQQRLKQTGTDVAIDSLRLGWSGAVSEVASLTLSVAQSRTRQDFMLRGLACPLPVQFCNGGLVPYVPVALALRSRREELQYSAGGNLRWGERSSLGGRVSRALTPGALGVSREDQVALNLGSVWSDRLRSNLGFDESRTAPPGGGAPARLRSLNLGGNFQWQEGLSIAVQWQRRQYRSATPDSGAGSKVISISLQYLGATVPGWQ